MPIYNNFAFIDGANLHITYQYLGWELDYQKLRYYLKKKLNVGVAYYFIGDTKHKQGSPFNVENNTNLIERFHGTLKARTKIMRGLKDVDTAKLFTEGWLLYYNYLRPHESLRGRTPARAAGVEYPYRNWQDIVAGRKVDTISQANATSYTDIPELPKGVKYTILRKRIIKRPRRKKRIVRREIQPSLMGVKV